MPRKASKPVVLHGKPEGDVPQGWNMPWQQSLLSIDSLHSIKMGESTDLGRWRLPDIGAELLWACHLNTSNLVLYTFSCLITKNTSPLKHKDQERAVRKKRSVCLENRKSMKQKKTANSALGESQQHRLTETFVSVKMSCGWFHRRRVDVNWLTATWSARPSFRRLSLRSTLASFMCGSLYRTSLTSDNKWRRSSAFVSSVNRGFNCAVLTEFEITYTFHGQACRVPNFIKHMESGSNISFTSLTHWGRGF